MTQFRCPACRARLGEEPACPRCGCDLILVRRAEAQAARLVVRALQAWAGDDRQGALKCARAALALEHSPLALGVLRCLVQAQDADSSRAPGRAEPARQDVEP